MNKSSEDLVDSNESESLTDACNNSLSVHEKESSRFQRCYGSVTLNQRDQNTESVSDSQSINKHFILSPGDKSFDYINIHSSEDSIESNVSIENVEVVEIIQPHHNDKDAPGIAILYTEGKKKTNVENKSFKNYGSDDCPQEVRGSYNAEESSSMALTELPFSDDRDSDNCKEFFLAKNDINSYSLSNSLSESTDSKTDVVEFEEGPNDPNESFQNDANFQSSNHDGSMFLNSVTARNTNAIECYYYSSGKSVTEQFHQAFRNEMMRNPSTPSRDLGSEAVANDLFEVESSISQDTDSGDSNFESALSSNDVTTPCVTPRNFNPKNNSFSPSKKAGISYAVTSENIPVAMSRKSIHGSRHSDASDISDKYPNNVDINNNNPISSRHDTPRNSKSIRKLLDLTCRKKVSKDRLSNNRVTVNQRTPIDTSFSPKQISLRNRNNPGKINNIKEFYSSRRVIVKRMNSKKFTNCNLEQPATGSLVPQTVNPNCTKKSGTPKNLLTDKRLSRDSRGSKTNCIKNEIIPICGAQVLEKNSLPGTKSYHTKKNDVGINLIQVMKPDHKIVSSSEMNDSWRSKSYQKHTPSLETNCLQNSKSIHRRQTGLEMDCVQTSKSIHKLQMGLEVYRYSSKPIIGQVNCGSNAANDSKSPGTTESKGISSASSSKSNPSKKSKFVSRIPRPIPTMKRKLVQETPNFEPDSDSMPLLLKMYSVDAEKSHSTNSSKCNRIYNELHRPSTYSYWSTANSSLSAQRALKSADNRKLSLIKDEQTHQINSLRTKYWQKSRLEPLLKVEGLLNQKSTISTGVSQPILNKSQNRITIKPQRIQTAPEKFDQRFRKKARPGKTEVCEKIYKRPSKVLSVSAIEEMKANDIKGAGKLNEGIISSVSLQLPPEDCHRSSNENNNTINEEPSLESISK